MISLESVQRLKVSDNWELDHVGPLVVIYKWKLNKDISVTFSESDTKVSVLLMRDNMPLTQMCQFDGDFGEVVKNVLSLLDDNLSDFTKGFKTLLGTFSDNVQAGYKRIQNKVR